MRFRYLLLVALLGLGCSGSGHAPVSGVVTMNGRPLAHATVVFQPDSTAGEPGPASAGTTDEKGRYTLELATGKAKGAVLGKHRVSITAYEGDVEGESSAPDTTNKVNRKALIPAEYNVNSTLEFEVKSGGSSAADFHLKSTPGKGR